MSLVNWEILSFLHQPLKYFPPMEEQCVLSTSEHILPGLIFSRLIPSKWSDLILLEVQGGLGKPTVNSSFHTKSKTHCKKFYWIL